MMILQILSGIMNGIYTSAWYVWTIAHHLGHHLCCLLLHLAKILGDFYSAMLLVKEDFIYFLSDLDQAFIYIGDLLYTSIDVSVQNAINLGNGICNFVRETFGRGRHQLIIVLKQCILSLCGGLSVIRNTIITIGQWLYWCLTLLPRLVWSICHLLWTSVFDMFTFLQKTIVHELYGMLTDLRFICSTFLILVVIHFLWSKRGYALQFTMRLINYFKMVNYLENSIDFRLRRVTLV